MRNLSFFLLLATAAAPALAADDSNRSDRQRGERAEQSETRSERAGRPQRAEQSETRSERAGRSQRADPSQHDARPERVENPRSDAGERRFGAQRSERNQANERGSFEAIRDRVEQQQSQREQGQRGTFTPPAASQPSGNWQRGDRPNMDSRSNSGWQPRERQVRTIPDIQPNVVPQHRDRRGLDGQRRDYRDGHYNRWTRDWHRDHRYDWRRHRDYNRSTFRIGFYYDPFGYNYRRWSVGSFLFPTYYGSRYWLNDPWQYRLPPAYGPYRWVRYWNDALLVNIYTGEVVDVIHSFFW